MKRRMLLALVTALVAVGASGCWGQVGYDPGHTRFNLNETTLTAANVGTLEEIWSVELNAEASEPMVRSGRVFLTTWTPNTIIDVRAVDWSTGETEWNRRFVDLGVEAGTFHTTAPTFVGRELWASYLGVAFVNGKPVGGMAAPVRIEPSDGSTIASESQLVGSAAIDVAGSVVQNWWQGPADQVVRVRDSATLTTAWQATFPREVFQEMPLPYPMAAVDGRLFVVDHNGVLHMFPLAGCGAAACTPAWSHDLGIIAAQSQPLAVGDQVFVVAGEPGNPDAGMSGFVALDGATGAVTGGGTLGNISFFPEDLAATTDTLYGALGDTTARLSAFAVEDDSCGSPNCLRWWTSLGTRATASPVVAGQVVYVGVPGEVRAYAAEGCPTSPCSPIATFALDGTPDHIVVAAGKLVVVHRPAAGAPARLTAFEPSSP